MPRHHQPDPFECPECGALVGNVRKHADWHRPAALDGANDDTVTLPPIRERILPAVSPAVRDLKGAELLLALAEELQREAEESGE